MICLVTIARNESRCIARCLNSAAPFVDEILVVDTGSTDDTREIARACGARVVEFAWQDDFSAARNFSLDQAPAGLRLVLDADEWIESGGDCLRAHDLAQGPPAVGWIRLQEIFPDGAAVRLPPVWLARVLPPGVRYEGRIHEQVVHALPSKRLALVVRHDGYQPQQQQSKGDRNERLLRLAAGEDPGSAYLRYQLGRELENHGRHADACPHYLGARELIGWPPASAERARALQQRYPWLHDLVVRHIYCLKRTRRYETAMALSGPERPYWQHSADFHFALGDLLLDMALADPQQASKWMALMEANWTRCLEIGETPELEGAIEGRGSYLAAHNLALMHELLGNAGPAAHFRAIAARPA